MNKKFSKKVFVSGILCVVGCLSLTGCNTVSGVARGIALDVEAMSSGIAETKAKDNQ